jgi:hypothetical protein
MGTRAAAVVVIATGRAAGICEAGEDDPRFPGELRAFLPRAYNLKAIADYETGPGSQVSAESAREAIHTAHRFVVCVAGLILATGHTPRAPEADAKP